jgi:hypothetical protein
MSAKNIMYKKYGHKQNKQGGAVSQQDARLFVKLRSHL